MFTDGYSVLVEEFAERHFIRSFEKKYKNKHWQVTLGAIKAILSRYDNIAPNHRSIDSKLDIICPCNKQMIVKLDFAVAGTNTPPKSAGNRVIAAVDSANRVIKILIVYSKNNIGPPNETAKWKKMISHYYDEFKSLK